MLLLIYRCFHSAKWDYSLIFLPLFPACEMVAVIHQAVNDSRGISLTQLLASCGEVVSS